MSGFLRGAARSGPSNPVPWWAAVLLAAAGGYLYDWGFPDKNVWPLAFVGLGFMLAAQIGRSVGMALLTGFVAGSVFFLVDIDWMSFYLGPVPWLAMTFFQAAMWAWAAALITLAFRWVPRAWPTRAGRLAILPVVVAGLWTTREHVTDNWPFRGFAWGRAALSQSESPFTPLVAWVGAAGLTFLVVWLTAFLVQVARERSLGWWRQAAVGAIAVCALLAVPAFPIVFDGSIRVGAVQGDGPAGYFQPHEQGDVERAQLEASVPLIGKDLDVLIWPEGSADVNPLADPNSAAALTALSTAVHAPLLVGAITESDGRLYNSSLVWDGALGAATAKYDKQHPVPFGEYVPAREFFHALAPDLVDLIQRDYTPGSGPNVIDVAGIRAGVSICFDIIDDWQLSQLVTEGGRIIFAQTNNADFIDPRTGEVSEETSQQLAAARLRAVEGGRALVNVSTVGTSELIGPDGKTLQSIPANQPGYLLGTLPLSSTVTPAAVVGQPLEWALTLLGVGLLALAGLISRNGRRA